MPNERMGNLLYIVILGMLRQASKDIPVKEVTRV
jgi:hypothetical protein